MSEIEVNKKLIEQYPFLLPHNRQTDEVDKDYNYSYTELDSMPIGWRKAFGIDICNEIKRALEKDTRLLSEYRITQIKEKYGTLRWYSNFTTKELSEVIDKYERLSSHTCIVCGKEATKISTGWISPYCDSCASKLESSGEHLIDIKEYYSEYKL